MTTYVYIATSLDGFIATVDGGLDWLATVPNPDNDDYGYAEFMGGIDAIVMGRVTYEKVLSFGVWPYERPVFVLSNSLIGVPDKLKGMVEIVRGDVGDLTQELSHRGYHNLYVDGGGAIHSFLMDDLIDEIIITRVPVILGSGIPLFRGSEIAMRFRHEGTKVHGNSLVMSHYVRDREGSSAAL
jgi:dihydrofolate reductase